MQISIIFSKWPSHSFVDHYLFIYDAHGVSFTVNHVAFMWFDFAHFIFMHKRIDLIRLVYFKVQKLERPNVADFLHHFWGFQMGRRQVQLSWAAWRLALCFAVLGWSSRQGMSRRRCATDGRSGWSRWMTYQMEISREKKGFVLKLCEICGGCLVVSSCRNFQLHQRW